MNSPYEAIITLLKDGKCRLCGKELRRGTKTRRFRSGTRNRATYECLNHPFPRESKPIKSIKVIASGKVKDNSGWQVWELGY